jgi:hypothetical protein
MYHGGSVWVRPPLCVGTLPTLEPVKFGHQRVREMLSNIRGQTTPPQLDWGVDASYIVSSGQWNFDSGILLLSPSESVGILYGSHS